MPTALLASALVGLCTGLLWHRWIERGRAQCEERTAGWIGPGDAAKAGSAGAVTAALAAPAVWLAVRDGYPSDSFLTLAPWARAGLAALSTVLIAVLLGLSVAKSAALYRAGDRRNVPPPLLLAADLAASAALLTGAVGLAPQIYYTYYRLILPGLPEQWQVRGWTAVETVLRQAQLSPDASLADHLGGLTFWSLMIMTCWLFVFAQPQVRRCVSSRLAGAGAALVCGAIYGFT